MKPLNYPLVCFDLDGTLVDDTIYIWKTLHDTFRTDKAVREKAYRDFYSGRITYPEWFAHDLKLLREAGADRAGIAAMLSTLKPMTGADEILRELKARGHTLAVISGSLDIVLSHLFDDDLFDHVLVNKLRFDEDGQISGGDPTPYDIRGKADGLRALAKKENLGLERTVFIGDNENDIWIAEVAGLSIAFNCKSDALRRICHAEVTVKDLRALGPLIS